MTAKLRLRIPELLEEAGLTAWGLHRAAPDAITPTLAYRLVRQRGELESFPRKTLEALARVFECEPGELLTFAPPHGELRAKRSSNRKAPRK